MILAGQRVPADAAGLTAVLSAMPDHMQVYVDWQRRWADTARPNQLLPDTDWTEAGILAGRGFGKTRVGAEWITSAAYEDTSGFDSCVIAPTYSDVKFTCFEGESGILSVLPPELLIEHNKSDMIVKIRNIAGGVSTIRGFTAEKPERLRGPQHTRAWCFIAGTMVATPDGERPIETLQPGDLVLTRKGPRCVVANASRLADVGSVQIGSEFLVGTADHPVYLSHGWTRMDRLHVGDQACVIVALNGAGSAGTDIAAGTTRGQTSPFGQSALSASTGSGGSPKSGRSRTAGTSITETRTKATTSSTILSAYRTVSTSAITSFANLFRRVTSAHTSSMYALTAARALSVRGECPNRSATAVNNAAPTASACRNEPVDTAASLSNLGRELSAASVVSTWRPLGQQYVYCLQVEGEPEYFANGILVHNCDELAAWQYADTVWDMAMMGLRLGANPQVLWTTTPKPRDIIRKLTAPQDKRIIVRGSTFDNKANLPESFFKQLEQYEGTVIGRQELYGELIDPEESGIIRRSWFNLWPAAKALPRFDWIIMSLDTAYTEKSVDSKGDPDPTACSVWGVFDHKKMSHVMLLDCWDDHLGLPALMRRVKRELNTAYGDDEDQALIKPLFGASKPMTSGRKPDILLIEDKGSGISLRQMLAEAGIEAYAYNPGRADKLSRLHIVSPVFAQRRVWLPESDKRPGVARSWCEAVVSQLCSFAGERSIKHDDHVDACTQAIRLCLDKGLIKLVKDKPKDGGDRPPPRVVSNPYAA